MERELLLSALVLLLCGPLVWVCAWLPWPGHGRRDRGAGSAVTERRTWFDLWAPLLPAALVFAVLLGWALAEPDPADERLSTWQLVLAALLLAPWLRTGWRLLRSLWCPRDVRTAATVGLLRPFVVVQPEFVLSLRRSELAAALAHERAHAAHWDPARLWLAGLATDLQWPAPGARRRLAAWRVALEQARDDDAVWAGCAGADLAAAIVAAARVQGGASDLVVGMADGPDLRERVQRLLGPPPPVRPAHKSLIAPVVLTLLAAAVLVGVVAGEPLVRLMVGMS